ncbi:MAG: TIM barrel protein [Caldilineaceae bacterium]|nr:TIM barrel protein [Caldilineaceae bacterium]
MKIAFSRPTADRSEQGELIENYSRIGYQGLQLKAGQYMPYVDTPQQFCDEWGAHAGVAAGLIFGGGLDDEGIARLRKLFAFGGAVGAERVIFCHGLPRAQVDNEDIKRFAQTLTELGKEAQQAGVALSLHHHYNQPVMHREDIALFFDTADPSAVGLTIDTAHLVKSGIDDVAGVIREFGAVIDNFHLKDFADGEWRVLGHGGIDFTPVFAAIHDIGYTGWLCADEESGGDIIGGMQECLSFIRQQAVRPFGTES